MPRTIPPSASAALQEQSAPQVQAAEIAAALKQFRLIYGNVRQHFRAIEEACGLGGAQLWALGLVRAQPGIRVCELAQAMSIHQTTTSNVVASLVRKGLLRRERLDADQRVVHLYVTEAAAAVLLRAPGPVEGLLQQALRHMRTEDVQQLNAVLQQVIGHMQTAHPEAADLPLADL